MKTLLTIIPCAMLACAVAQAGEPTTDGKTGPTVETKATAGNQTEVKSYEPKHKSVFLAASEHNPFWPIGWTKSEVVAADAPAPEVPHASDFMVSTILLNDPPMAVINGKEMAEGEVADFPLNGQEVRMQLMSVMDGRVVLRWQTTNIVVPLHRDEDLTGTYNGQPATALR